MSETDVATKRITPPTLAARQHSALSSPAASACAWAVARAGAEAKAQAKSQHENENEDEDEEKEEKQATKQPTNTHFIIFYRIFSTWLTQRAYLCDC